MKVSSRLMALSLLLLTLLLLALGIAVGSTGFGRLAQVASDPVALQIVLDIRLPRSLGAWLAGALLGLSGAVAQGLFRNPLADPFLLGSASGASLGVAAGLLGLSAGQGLASGGLAMTWLTRLGLTGAAFVGAVVAVLLTLQLARGVQHTLRLLLAGVIVGVVLGAAKDLITLAVPEVVPAMQGFNLGSVAYVGWPACTLMALALLACWGVSVASARILDALGLGVTTALSLGVPLARARWLLVAVMALATGTAVAQTGLIAFVGLAAPHMVRQAVTATHGRRIGLSALTGGVLLLGADILARWLLAPQELPVGVLTALMGGGYLLWLMHRRGALRGGLS
jgi:iron complex transport system permease protein